MKTYLLVSVGVFFFLFFMGIWLDFPVGEAALASAVLTTVGLVITWWKTNF